jgi:phosphonate transport system substrate-binding protein
MKKLLSMIAVLSLLSLTFSGCATAANTTSAASAAASTAPAASAASEAAAENMPSKFVIAYLPGDATNKNGDARKGMEADLSKAIGIPVEEFQASDYNAVIEAMRTGKVDMALFGPLSLVLAADRANAEAIGMIGTKGDKASAHYNSVFIVKADSPIQKITDIKGKKIAFVDANSTSGNLVPSYEIMNNFKDESLTMDSLHTNGKFFSSAIYSGGHPASMQAVLKGDVDVAPVATDSLKTAEASGDVDAKKIRVIYKSFDIPNSPMAIWGKLPQTLKQKVTTFLTTYENNEYFSKMLAYDNGCFYPCTNDDFKQVADLNKKING